MCVPVGRNHSLPPAVHVCPPRPPSVSLHLSSSACISSYVGNVLQIHLLSLHVSVSISSKCIWCLGLQRKMLESRFLNTDDTLIHRPYSDLPVAPVMMGLPSVFSLFCNYFSGALCFLTLALPDRMACSLRFSGRLL